MGLIYWWADGTEGSEKPLIGPVKRGKKFAKLILQNFLHIVIGPTKSHLSVSQAMIIFLHNDIEELYRKTEEV